MGTKRYLLETDLDTDFEVLALHTSLPGFKLAFLLNQWIKSQFRRAPQDLYLQQTAFEYYLWEDSQQGIRCTLFQNKSQHEETQPTNALNLFEFTLTKEVYLLAEAKSVPYLLKINEGPSAHDLKKSLEKHPQISMCYPIEDTRIKGQLNILNE